MNHSIRLFENEHHLTASTQIINIVEQPLKIVTHGQPSMINAIGLVLAETIFHPQGGGQPSDQGTVNDSPMLTVREDRTQLNKQGSPTIYHYLDVTRIDSHKFKIGQKIEITVDAEFRAKCQRSHSAGHLIADALELNSQFKIYQPKATHGNHFPGSEYIKVVMASQPNNQEQFCQQINDCLDQLINDNLPVALIHQNNNPRHIEIGNSARMCGGTHVKFSKEAAGCKVTKIKFSKNKEGQIAATVFYQC